MSKTVRTSRKTPKKDWRAVQLTPAGLAAIGQAPTQLDLVAALFGGHDPATVATMLPFAQDQLPGLVSEGFACIAITEAVQGVIKKVHPSSFATAEEWLDATKPNTAVMVTVKHLDALCSMHWLHAEAGFALGLAAGLRLGGVR